MAGQEAIATALMNAVSGGRVGHAYLFVGPRGVGKTSMARILSKALNCPKAKGGIPCNECDICRDISAGSDLDVIEFDAASHRTVEVIQEKILDNVSYRPSRSKFKIYIVDEVHMISNHAFNALLKTLEDPPAHVKFIFATTEPHKIPDTILSRCQRFDFRNIPNASIAQRLTAICKSEGVKADASALEFVARLSGGSMRDSQTMLDQLIAFSGSSLGITQVHAVLGTSPVEDLCALAHAVADEDYANILAMVTQIYSSGKDLSMFLRQSSDFFRDILVCQVVGQDSDLIHLPLEGRGDLAVLSGKFTSGSLHLVLQILGESQARLRGNTANLTVVELAFLKLPAAVSMLTIPDMLKRLEVLEQGRPVQVRSSAPPNQPTRPFVRESRSESVYAPAQKAELPKATKTQAVGKNMDGEKSGGAEFHVSPENPDLLVTLKGKWSDIVESVRDKDKRLAGFMKEVVLENASATRIRIGVPEGYSLHKEVLEEFDNRKKIVDAIEALMGFRPTLAFETVDLPDVNTEEPEPEEEKRNRKDTRTILLEEVNRDPVIRKARELFDGTIVDIES